VVPLGKEGAATLSFDGDKTFDPKSIYRGT
jgi:hypothetical protein